MAHIAIQNLTFSYPRVAQLALNGLSLELAKGEFVVLCGKSGCGKTTLLRQLKTALQPEGQRTGEIFFAGRPLAEVSAREQASLIGFVLQNPDNQIVTDKVWHELAFGLESLGMPKQTIRLRVAEMASFFGIQEWYHKKVVELSGGQKQLLNLAAVMAMQPELLILDEPTSQLDPIAASEFLAAVKKVNGELGVTVLLSEHRLEDALPLANRVVVMRAGQVLGQGTPAAIGKILAAQDDPMLYAMPTPMRAALTLPEPGEIPISVREGRSWLANIVQNKQPNPVETTAAYPPATAPAAADGKIAAPDAAVVAAVAPAAAAAPAATAPAAPTAAPDAAVVAAAAPAATTAAAATAPAATTAPPAATAPTATAPATPTAAPVAATGKATAPSTVPVISAQDVWFRYEKNGNDILRGLNIAVYPGEFLAIVGGNGTGKSTALGVLSGQLRAYRGKLRVAGLDPGKVKGSQLFAAGLTVLPQDPQTLFLCNTILEDLDLTLPAKMDANLRNERLSWAIQATEIADIVTKHPYDVSGGEQQRAALAKALLSEPKYLFLDEPTKGMDSFYKQKFAAIIKRLQAGGLTILMVSHDVEFCAAYSDRCALFFDGGVVTEDSPRAFFSGNSFYTTAANRMSRGLLNNIVTTDDLIEALKWAC